MAEKHKPFSQAKEMAIMSQFFVLLGFLVAMSCSCSFLGIKISVDHSPEILFPDWILRESAHYPFSRYFTGVGFSSTISRGFSVALLRASDDARTEIAKIIEVEVEHTQKMFQQTTSSMVYRADRSDLIYWNEFSDLSSFTRTSTNQIIQGIGLKEKFHDPKEHVLYVLAVLDRVATAGRLEREIQEFDYQVALLSEKAKKKEDNQDLINAVRVYREALEFSLKSDILRRQYSVINPYPSREYDREYDFEHSSMYLAFQLRELLPRIKIYISANDFDFVEKSIHQVASEAGFSVVELSSSHAFLALQCSINTSHYRGLGKYNKLHVCRVSLRVKIMNNRTKQIVGEFTLLANSNAEDQNGARDRALRVLNAIIKEDFLKMFYKALGMEIFE